MAPYSAPFRPRNPHQQRLVDHASEATAWEATAQALGQRREPAALRFVLVSGEAQAALADAVFEPGNVRGAALVVALVVGGKGPVSFDAGRCARNMLLAAWPRRASPVRGLAHGRPRSPAA